MSTHHYMQVDIYIFIIILGEINGIRYSQNELDNGNLTAIQLVNYLRISYLQKPAHYLATILTILPGTYISFTTVFPSRRLPSASFAAAKISSFEASAGTSIVSLVFPLS